MTWNDAATNEIEVIYYEMPYIVSGLDITADVLPTEINFDNDTLTINEPQMELTYYTLKPTIQMVENYIEGFNYDSPMHSYFIGHRILHLNIPKHITIMDRSGWLNYLYN